MGGGGGSAPLRLGGFVVVSAEAVAEELFYGARLGGVLVGEAQAAAADVADGRAAENPDDLRRRPAVVRHREDVRDCTTDRLLRLGLL